MGFDYSGQTAVVTGGANGIGLACAQLLAAGGAKVTVFDLERERPSEIAAGFGGRGVICDVTSRASIDAAFAQVAPPDIVVANAGTAVVKPMSDHTRADWDRVIALNLTGLWETVQASANLMKTRRRGGSIVLTASTNSYDGEANLIAYNASKAGVLGILHTAANELGPHGIRVNAVNPGLIETRLTASSYADPSVLKDYFRAIPMGRGGKPEEVAQAVGFLASRLASYITGTTLLVDGGQMCCKFGTWSDDSATFANGRWTLSS